MSFLHRIKYYLDEEAVRAFHKFRNHMEWLKDDGNKLDAERDLPKLVDPQ